MVNIEKWINELQIAVADLARKVSATAGALKPTITDPVEGQAIIYDGTGWVNGSAVPPAPEPANPLLIINHGTTVDNIVQLSPDGTSAWTQAGAKLKSGSGTFTSYAISVDADITSDLYDKIAVTYTFQSNTVTQEVAFADLTLVDGVVYEMGVYYRSDSQGCYAGVILAPKTRPQDFTLYQISQGTGASGDIVVSDITVSKTTNSTKRRKTK